MEPRKDIFKKITDPLAKAEVFRTIAAQRIELTCKTPEPLAELLILKCFEYHSPVIKCLLSGSSQSPKTSGDLIITTYLGAEKYFFQTNYKIVQNDFVLQEPTDLFQLQRREYFRFRIPKSVDARVTITKIDGSSKKVVLPVFDLSGGGLGLEVPSYSWNPNRGQKIEGQLYLQDRGEFPFTGQVKHVAINSMKKDHSSIGVEFTDIQVKYRERIIAAGLDFYKQYFAKPII